MQTTDIQAAAEELIKRRLSRQKNSRLEQGLRPQTTEDALAIQQAVSDLMEKSGQDSLAGWKCSLPFENSIVVAPLFSKTIFNQSPCPIHLDDGICKIEPEIAFRFKNDLPSRKEAYSELDIIEALDGVFLALELIQNRYLATEEVPYIEHLADSLFNQGLFIGPQISLEKAFSASKIQFILKQENTQTIPGKHPNQLPQKPLFWLVNFLSQRGIDIKAGHLVITGSYAGVLEVEANQAFSLEYQDLGKMDLTFIA